MEITNICPYCGKEMREGALPAYKYALTWCPRNEQGGIVEGEPIRLSKTPVLGGVYAPARYCESCRVVIVPVPEIETFADKAGKRTSLLHHKHPIHRKNRLYRSIN